MERKQGELVYPRPDLFAAWFPRIVTFFGKFATIDLADEP